MQSKTQQKFQLTGTGLPQNTDYRLHM